LKSGGLGVGNVTRIILGEKLGGGPKKTKIMFLECREREAQESGQFKTMVALKGKLGRKTM